MNRKYLAESVDYKIESEFETVILIDKAHNNKERDVAWVYGDPDCAYINYQQTFAVIGGTGVHIVDLTNHQKEPVVLFDKPDQEFEVVSVFNDFQTCFAIEQDELKRDFWVQMLARNGSQPLKMYSINLQSLKVVIHGSEVGSLEL